MIIIDTCIVIHLFNETELTKLAQEVLRKDPNWILPSLWKEEYANVLSKLARKEQRPINEVIEHYNHTLEELKDCEIPVDNRKALLISIKFKISVYDAHFVSLASDFNSILVTEDKEILKNSPVKALNMKNFLKINV